MGFEPPKCFHIYTVFENGARKDLGIVGMTHGEFQVSSFAFDFEFIKYLINPLFWNKTKNMDRYYIFQGIKKYLWF